MSKNCHFSARVEPLVFVIGVWPSNRYELHIVAPDSSNRVRGLDDLLNALVGEAVFSARKYCLILPFTVMMPRGPGILSVREAQCGIALKRAKASRPSSA